MSSATDILKWPDKINSAELLAFLRQYGTENYFTAAEINELRDVVNGLHLAKEGLVLDKLDKGNFDGNGGDLYAMIQSLTAGTRFVGGVTTSSALPTDGIAGENLSAFVGPGTYPNWGGMVVPDNNIGVLMRIDGGFSVSSSNINLSGYVNKTTDITYLAKENKFNKLDNSVGGQTYQNQGINNLGVIGANTGWVGAKIPVSASTAYCFKHNDNVYLPNSVGLLAYLNSSSAIISTVDMSTLTNATGLGGKTLTTPTGTAFIYKNVKVVSGTTKDYVNDFQLELGSITSVYKSYDTVITNINGKELKDLSLTTSVSTNTSNIAVNISNIADINNRVLGTKNWSVSAKANTVNPTKVQMDFVFDLNGLTYTTGTAWNIAYRLNSTDSNLGSAIQMRTFQNSVSTAPSTAGTAGSIVTVGSFSSPFIDISTNSTLLNDLRYLHVYLEVTLTNGTLPTLFRYDNIKLTLGGSIITPSSWGIYTPNVGDTVLYNPKLTTDIALYSNIPSTASFQSNYLNGKKLVVIGDSMVKGHSLASNLVWDYLIASRNGMTNVNYGINGTQLTNDNGFGLSVLNRYSSMDNDADYIGVFALTNDDVANVPIGADSDSYTGGQLTVKGALNDLCIGLLNKYPNKKVFFITPYNRRSQTQSYITAMIVIAKKYSIPIFDNWTNGGVCWTNATQIASITLSDSYHLNTAGMVYASYKYESFIRSL